MSYAHTLFDRKGKMFSFIRRPTKVPHKVSPPHITIGEKMKAHRRLRFLDMLVYRLYVWWWGPILAARPDLRELMIVWMKAYDVVNDGEDVVVTIEYYDKEKHGDLKRVP